MLYGLSYYQLKLLPHSGGHRLSSNEPPLQSRFVKQALQKPEGGWSPPKFLLRLRPQSNSVDGRPFKGIVTFLLKASSYSHRTGLVTK